MKCVVLLVVVNGDLTNLHCRSAEVNWNIMTSIEDLWKRKTNDQIFHKVDYCLFRSVTAKSSWARRYWHGVAEDLVEKYVS